MKLIDAPTIVRKFTADSDWIAAAAARVRVLHSDPPKENRQGVDQTGFDLKQLAEDVWSIDGQLGIHTDKTRKGFRVIGVVLVNEPRLRLVTHDGIFRLEVGTVYHIDGRSPHGALEVRRERQVSWDGTCRPLLERGGLFGFMAWDVHRNEDIEELISSIPESMTAFANGEARIDVSTAVRDLPK